MTKFSVAIMAGGMSKRFGGDKTLAALSGELIYKICIKKALELSDDILFISKDLSKYEKDRNVRYFSDEHKVQCPLNGIYTALKHAENDYVFVISVDSPLFSVKSVIEMSKLLESQYALAPCINSKIYPLYAFYKKTCENQFLTYLNEEKYRLYSILQENNAAYLNDNFFIQINGSLDEFININTQDDLISAENILRR